MKDLYPDHGGSRWRKARLPIHRAAVASGRADRPRLLRRQQHRQSAVDASQHPVRPDLRWDDIGVAGHPFVETPNIDRVAREGVRFVNAFATTPLCSPSRASFLTGQYAHTNGIVDNTAGRRLRRLRPLVGAPTRVQLSEMKYYGEMVQKLPLAAGV